MMTRKTEKNNILVYAVKSDDNQKTESNVPGLCLKSDDNPKTKKTNILAYAVKSDDG